jgi:hypothetical protein
VEDRVIREGGIALKGIIRASSYCRNEDYVSKHFERWEELAVLCLREQDTEKLTELANEMNLVLTQKTPHLDPPLREPLE